MKKGSIVASQEFMKEDSAAKSPEPIDSQRVMKMSLVLDKNEINDKTNTGQVKLENRSPLVPGNDNGEWLKNSEEYKRAGNVEHFQLKQPSPNKHYE